MTQNAVLPDGGVFLTGGNNAGGLADSAVVEVYRRTSQA